MSDPLIWARVVHFASTVLLSGTVLFVSFVAEPAFRRDLADDPVNIIVRLRLARLVWIASGLVLISGAAWFLLQTARMVDLPVSQIFSKASLLTVLTETDFGRDWIARLLLLVLLAGTTLRSDPKQVGSPGRRLVIVALATSFVGSLAWAGHGAAGSGLTGGVHLASDALHLMAAAAWVGALVPLAMFFGAMEAGNERSVKQLDVGRERECADGYRLRSSAVAENPAVHRHARDSGREPLGLDAAPHARAARNGPGSVVSPEKYERP